MATDQTSGSESVCLAAGLTALDTLLQQQGWGPAGPPSTLR